MRNSQERVIGGSPGTFLSGALGTTHSRKNAVKGNLPGDRQVRWFPVPTVSALSQCDCEGYDRGPAFWIYNP